MQEKCVHFMVHSMSLWLDYICVHVLYTTLCHSCVSDLDSSHITRLKFMHFGGQLLSV